MLYDRNGSSNPALAEINITPLIDVLLTVMIIFMITAPLVARKIDLPLAGGTIMENPPEPRVFTVAIHDSGEIMLNGQSTNRLTLARSLRAAVLSGTPMQLDVRPEARSSYDNLAQILTIAKNNEVTNLRVIAASDD